MNTIVLGWIDNQFRIAIENRNSGRVRSQPVMNLTQEFLVITESQLFPLGRSVFTSRLRRTC